MKTERETGSNQNPGGLCQRHRYDSGGGAEIAKVLRAGRPDHGRDARVQDVKDIKPYSAVVFGTALAHGQADWSGRALCPTLQHRPGRGACSGLFGGHRHARGYTQSARRYPGHARAHPASHPGAGQPRVLWRKLDYSKLNPLFRFMFSRIKSDDLAEGDWRDWEAIRAWAAALVPLLTKLV